MCEEKKKTESILVGKLLRSTRHLSIMFENQGISVDDIVMIVESEEYDCYCRNKNNGLFACIEIAWLPRIELRYLTKREEVCGVDMPLALLHLMFPGVEGIAPELNQRSIEQFGYYCPSSSEHDHRRRQFFKDNLDWNNKVW